MKDYLGIKSVNALEVLDSRGNPTIQVEVITDGGFCGTAIVPSGASTGKFEAVELRDGDENRYFGKGVLQAVNNVNKKIAPKLENMNVYEQAKIDQKLIKLDGTENKGNLGANAILGVSIAVAKAAANSLGMTLYNYIGGINAKTLPMPMMNILNGGKHADNNINIQEFMIIPLKAKSFTESMEICNKVYNVLKKNLKSKRLSTAVGDEGGFAPNLESDEEALDLIVAAIGEAGFIPRKDIGIALDVASSEMKKEAENRELDGYYFWKSDILKSTTEMIEYYSDLIDKYPIISIEDGLDEEDWDGWFKMTTILGNKIMLVGDDLFVTNLDRLKKGLKQNVANSILIKPNQIGTLTETLETIEIAKCNGYKIIISHRSGETEDSFIADLAVAVNSGYIKAGAPCRTDRIVKYNRLLNIENYENI